MIEQIDNQIRILLNTKGDILSLATGKNILSLFLQQCDVAIPSSKFTEVLVTIRKHITCLFLKTEKFAEEYGNIILGEISTLRISGRTASPKATVMQEIEQELIVLIKYQVLKSFKQENGIRDISRMTDKQYSKRLLFGESTFYSQETFQELTRLVMEVATNKVVRDNFREYFFNIMQAALEYEGTVIEEMTVIEFLTSNALLKIFYQVYTAVPLFKYGEMYFEHYFAKLKQQYNLDILAKFEDLKKEI